MAGISIPGVTDQYKTNDTVEKLMKVERIPLTREQNQLETYKTERDAWRDINTKLSNLRDKTKTLYSFENPFNNKLSTSSEEYAITADANRSAQIQSFKVDVIQPATSDRFLSAELENNEKVPQGIYTYKIGEKQISFNWKGGSLKDFTTAINKRGNNLIKATVIGASSGKKSLLIEAIPTGKENRLIFEDDAKTYAFDSKMIIKLKSESQTFGDKQNEISPAKEIEYNESQYLPQLSLTKTKLTDKNVIVEPRGAFQVELPTKIANDTSLHVQFTVKATQTEDITPQINKSLLQPVIPGAGYAEFEGIVVNNMDSQTNLNLPPVPPQPLEPVQDESVLFAIMNDGSEKAILTPNLLENQTLEMDISLQEFQGIKALAVRNRNTGTTIEISHFTATDPFKDLGYGPANAISKADDSIIKYEGITITRPTNKIDDVIPEVTLNLHDKTDKTATISIKPDVESSKDAIIQFVGQYNQTVAELNILSQTKPAIVDELDYLTKEEKDEQKKKLGMFQTEFSLTNIKSNMSSTLTSKYPFSDTAEITMLSQAGIATNASGFSGGYSESKLRGYLEIDEKKLDSALENNLDDIRQLFGYDSDGDLIVDSGIAYKLDKQITAYTQTGGILALKTSTLDTKIKSSEQRISKLETQMDTKEAELRYKYGQMEGSLNSLESQQNAISNFTKQQQRSQ